MTDYTNYANYANNVNNVNNVNNANILYPCELLQDLLYYIKEDNLSKFTILINTYNTNLIYLKLNDNNQYCNIITLCIKYNSYSILLYLYFLDKDIIIINDNDKSPLFNCFLNDNIHIAKLLLTLNDQLLYTESSNLLLQLILQNKTKSIDFLCNNYKDYTYNMYMKISFKFINNCYGKYGDSYKQICKYLLNNKINT